MLQMLSAVLVMIPACKPHMMAAWRLHAAWGRGRAELPCRALPFTPLLLYALAQAAFNRGWRDTTVLLILGFHTFGRSGELFQARCKDCVLSSTSETWKLPLSKSRQHSRNVESILLHDLFVCVAAQNFIRGKSPGDLLSLCSPQTQLKRLSELWEGVGLSTPCRWYSVCRGGATHKFRQSGNIGQISLRGRWNSQKTAKSYICEGVAKLTELQLPATQKQAVALKARPSWKAYY